MASPLRKQRYTAPMQKLASHFEAARGNAASLARATGASPVFLRAIAKGTRPCPPKLAVKIEQVLGPSITRRDFFPEDWLEIWPELRLGEVQAVLDADVPNGAVPAEGVHA